MTVRQLFSDLLKPGEPHSIAAASLLCPKKLFDSASVLADDDEFFKRMEISPNLVLFSTQKYIIVPGKFCSCHYFQEKVVNLGVSWTCKHDLGVRLRVALRGLESIKLDKGGRDTVLKFLVK
jgi:predicted nucleic acid-binding Zn finger protein